MANEVTGASLSQIYGRLNSAPRHHPVGAKTFTDWSVEAGDMITITRNGQQYQSPVHTSSMNWKGGAAELDVGSTGNEKRDPVAKTQKKKYNSGSGGMRHQEEMYNDIWSDDGHLHSVIEQTSSSIHEYVEDVYKQLKAGLNLTSSSAALYVQDMYKRLKSGLDLTSSSASLYVQDMYRQLKSGLDLTSSSASLYVNDAYNRLKSGLDLTSSSASLYVRDMYKRMKSGLDLTSSSAALYVRDMYSRLKSGLDVTSSSAAIYADSKTTRAYIMTRINASGEGEALIEADKVSITGRTTINQVMTISDNRLSISTPARISGNVMMQSLTMRDGSSDATLLASDFETVIKSASVSGNTLTLTPIRGTAITFSKATSLSGSWSGSTLTVTASPQNQHYTIGFGGSYSSHNTEFEVVANGNVSKDTIVPSAIVVPLKVGSLNNGAASTARYTKDLTVSIASLLQSRTLTSNGSYTPESGYIGISSVSVDVTPTISGQWNGSRTFTATAQPKGKTITTTLRSSVPNNKRTVSGGVMTATIQAVVGDDSQSFVDCGNVTINVPEPADDDIQIDNYHTQNTQPVAPSGGIVKQAQNLWRAIKAGMDAGHAYCYFDVYIQDTGAKKRYYFQMT